MKFLFSLSIFTFFLATNSYSQQSFEESRDRMGIDDKLGNYGVSIIDYNNDGYDDIYIARSSYENLNALYKNLGDGTFLDVSQILNDESRNSSAGLWVDIDNNGYLDLIVVNSREKKRVYLNFGNDTFENFTDESGIDDISDTKSFNAGDLNNDGFIDLYANNFRVSNSLYLNNGNGVFTNSISGSGADNLLNAMGGVIFDYDLDGYQDIYLTFDGQPYILYQNNGDATFTDVAAEKGVAYEGFGMGVDIADLNHDGLMDIHITNYLENTLLCSIGEGFYEDVSEAAGIQDKGMAWGTNFLDLENDGKKEIYIVNQYSFSPFDNLLYKNEGEVNFSNSSLSEIASQYNGYGSAVADLNNDGLQDLVVANYNHQIEVFVNRSTNSSAGNYFSLRLFQPQLNTHCIGCKLELLVEDVVYTDVVEAGNSYLSQSSYALHFGLNDIEVIPTLRVTWSDGTVEIFENVTANQNMMLVKGKNLTKFSKEQLELIFPPTEREEVLGIKSESQIGIITSGDVINLEFQERSNRSISIYDLQGRGVFSETIQSNSINIDWSIWNNGIYILRVAEGRSVFTRKIVKK